MNWEQLARQLRAAYSTDDVVSALIGDGVGNVWFNEARKICYIRVHGDLSQRTLAVNYTGCVQHNAWVDVKRIQHANAPHLVLGDSIRSGRRTSTTTPTGVGLHAQTHEQVGKPNTDPVDIYPTAIIAFRAQPTDPSSMSIYINAGMMYIDNLRMYAGGSVGPFTQPTWGQRTDLVYLTSNAVPVIVQGEQTITEGALWPDGPAIPNNTKPIAFVLVKASISTIEWEQLKPLHVLDVGLGMDSVNDTYAGPIGWFGQPLHTVGPEIPIGQIDGINQTFITEYLIEPDSLCVYKNGQLQTRLLDYVELGTRQGFTCINPPVGGDVVVCNYRTEKILV